MIAGSQLWRYRPKNTFSAVEVLNSSNAIHIRRVSLQLHLSNMDGVLFNDSERLRQQWNGRHLPCTPHPWPLVSLHKGPVTPKSFPWDYTDIFILWDILLHRSLPKLRRSPWVYIGKGHGVLWADFKCMLYIAWNKHVVVLCFIFAVSGGCAWLIYPYPSGLLHLHWGNWIIALMPIK